jgi:hypothetical protein
MVQCRAGLGRAGRHLYARFVQVAQIGGGLPRLLAQHHRLRIDQPASSSNARGSWTTEDSVGLALELTALLLNLLDSLFLDNVCIDTLVLIGTARCFMEAPAPSTDEEHGHSSSGNARRSWVMTDMPARLTCLGHHLRRGVIHCLMPSGSSSAFMLQFKKHT